MTIDQIEKKLKSKAKTINRHRAKRAKEYPHNAEHYKSVKWQNVLDLKWQVRNKVFKGCSGKAVFNPIEMGATSYHWWTFVKKIKGKVVFNDYNYSMTTCRHQNSVRYIMKELGIKIDLEIETHAGLEHFESMALQELYRELFNLEIASKRQRARDNSKEITEVKKKIAMARKLGAKISADGMEGIKQRCLQNETKRLENLRLKSQDYKKYRDLMKQVEKNNKPVDLSTIAA